MRLPWKSKPQPPEPVREERRVLPEWCATCRSPFGPFVHLENGRHYCEPCAERIQSTMGLKVMERRSEPEPVDDEADDFEEWDEYEDAAVLDGASGPRGER